MSPAICHFVAPGALCAVLAGLWAGGAGATPLAPSPVSPSALSVQAVPVMTPFTRGPNNLGSPKVVHGALHFIDQRGRVIRQGPDGFATILDLADPAQTPAGFTFRARVSVLDIAEGPGGDMIVSTVSRTLPDAAPAAPPLPDADVYRDDPDYHVVYRYARQADGTLAAPTALASFTTGPHRGGALLGLNGGDVIFATGDGLTFGLDGRAAPQDDGAHLSKLLRINGRTGAVDVLAKGVRNVQRLTWADAARSVVAFADMGGAVAEEVNTVPLADLLDTTEIENFGWGRNPDDGQAREGTFYVGPGAPSTSGVPEAVGIAPPGEAGFLQPLAQWGREDLTAAAVSGPVFAPISFDGIDLLFGDLISGQLFATTAHPETGLAEVFRVRVLDETGAPTTLLDLAGTSRADARFFNFPDMSAGVLLERAGAAYRLTEVTAVPVPATGLLLLSVLGLLGYRAART